MKPKTRAFLLLGAATLIWGLSYPVGRAAVSQISPWAFSGLRFLFGGLSLLPMALRQRRRPAPLAYTGRHSPRLWLWAGLLVGLILTCGGVLQTYAMTRLPAGQVSFLSALYSPLVPVMALALGFVPRPLTMGGLLVSLGGLYLLTGGLSGLGPAEGLVMAANFFWAAQIVVSGYFAAKVNTWLFIMAQTISGGLLMLSVAFLAGLMPSGDLFFRTLPLTLWGVLSAGVAYVCQTTAQKDLSPTAVAVMSPLQTVVAAAAGVLFLNEILSRRMVCGAAVIIAGSLIAQFARDAAPLTPAHPRYRLLNRSRRALLVLIPLAVLGLTLWALKSFF